jgi:hypothetical protein
MTIRAATAAALAMSLALVACAPASRQVPQPKPPASSGSSRPEPGAASTRSAAAGGRGDLTRGPVTHTVTSTDLRVRITYAPVSPVGTWSPEGSKPLDLTVSVTNRRAPSRKVYLSRATLRFNLDDGSSDIPAPEPLTDTSNIVPGYLATSPYAYVQSFAIPVLDPTSRTMLIDTRLELVSLVDPKAHDYTKQTVTDTVRASLDF